jgi:outer membrane protein assembly factor BamB
MSVLLRGFLLASLASSVAASPLSAGAWSQFRGPNASGRPEQELPLPDSVDQETNLVWKVAMPSGHSSPAVFGDQIFVTTADRGQLSTVALDRKTGQVQWEASAPHDKLEEIHNIGSYAQPSPATDGERVVSFFGSAGLFCYDTAGKPLWNIPMGPFRNDFGAGSSPILVDDRVILCQDHDTDSFLMAIDKRTGKPLWKTDRSEFPRNYCTPVIWNVEGKKQIVIAATLRIAAYDFDDGHELWTVRGVARIVNMTPTIGDDGILYVACWSPGGDEKDRISAAPFSEILTANDANGSGTLEKEEAPEGAVRQRFSQIDRDKNGKIVTEEYESMRRVFENAHNVVMAIKPGGQGDITATHVLWKYRKVIPYCPSPLCYRGRVYMIKDGGILTVLDAATGRPLKEGRIKATGGYYSSPVAGDGKVYLLSQRGELTVLIAGDDFRELSTTDFGENGFATPAIVDGRIYVRTSGHLYCFARP